MVFSISKCHPISYRFGVIAAYWSNIKHFAFLSPLWGLGTTYDVHFGLNGKRVVDFLLVLIELVSLGRTDEALRAIICSKSAISLQRKPVDPKFQVEGVAPTNHSASQKTSINVLSLWYKNLNIAFFRFVTMHAFDRRTDGRTDRRTEFSSLDRVCIPCSAVKMSPTVAVRSWSFRVSAN